MNNRLIADSQHLTWNKTPFYYHWCPGLYPKIGLLVQDESLIKYRLKLTSNPNVNCIGMIIGPKGVTHKSLEDRTGCRIFVKGTSQTSVGSDAVLPWQHDTSVAHVLVVAENSDQLGRSINEIEQVTTLRVSLPPAVPNLTDIDL
jgi:hypothetical protein